MRDFVTSTGIENLGPRLINSKQGKVRATPAPGLRLPLCPACLSPRPHPLHASPPPALPHAPLAQVTFEKPSMTMDTLMKYGRYLVDEQENVKRVQLADEYLDGAALAGSSGSSLPETYKAR